jgi:hypothetical protein
MWRSRSPSWADSRSCSLRAALSPREAGARASKHGCGLRGQLLLETLVCDALLPVMRLEEEWPALNPALRGIDHPPSVAYLALVLNRVGFEHVHAPLASPRFDDFDWQPLGTSTSSEMGTSCGRWSSRSTLDRQPTAAARTLKAAYWPAGKARRTGMCKLPAAEKVPRRWSAYSGDSAQ